MKKKYYKIMRSTDVKEVGSIFSLLNSQQVDNFVDKENNTPERFGLYSDVFGEIDETLDLTKFKVQDKAKMTDLMSSRFFWSRCIYSPKFATIYNEYLTGNAKLIPCKLNHKDVVWDYYLMSIKDTMEIVDFDQSEFMIYNPRKSSYISECEKNVTPENFWEVLGGIEDDSKDELTLKARKIVLNTPIDLFHLELDNGYYISERFKNEIEQKGLTGFDFDERPFNYDFYGDWEFDEL